MLRKTEPLRSTFTPSRVSGPWNHMVLCFQIPRLGKVAGVGCGEGMYAGSQVRQLVGKIAMQARRALSHGSDGVLVRSTHFGFGQTCLQVLPLLLSYVLCDQTGPLPCRSHLDRGVMTAFLAMVVTEMNGNKYFFMCKTGRIVLTSGQLKG